MSKFQNYECELFTLCGNYGKVIENSRNLVPLAQKMALQSQQLPLDGAKGPDGEIFRDKGKERDDPNKENG